jgi:hypothetical protein
MFSVGKYKVTQENLRCAAVSSFWIDSALKLFTSLALSIVSS